MQIFVPVDVTMKLAPGPYIALIKIVILVVRATVFLTVYTAQIDRDQQKGLIY